MYVWGGGSPGSSRCPEGEATPHPLPLLGFLEALPGIWRSAVGQAGRRWGGNFLPGLAGEGGRGIRSCPQDGSDMSPELLAGTQQSWELGGAASWSDCVLVPHTPGPSPNPLPTQISGDSGRKPVMLFLHGGSYMEARGTCSMAPSWQPRQCHCSHAQLPAWGAR